MRLRLLVLLVLMSFLRQAPGQILHLEELNTEQIRALDRAKTVVIIPGGILEEHGPYLPSFTDGYSDQAYSEGLARAIVARPGWTALLFPQIPLGSNPANDIGEKRSFPGSYPVRTATLRALYMDLGDDLGAQGFRWVFLLHNHLGPANSFALDQAGDYFHDTYGGRMVHLLGLEPVANAIFVEQQKLLTPAQLKENGVPIHADASEHSDVLFLRPELVSPGYRTARSVSGATMADVVRLGHAPDWPGYFGVPRFATASQGALDFNVTMALVNEYALKILEGMDVRSVQRHGDISLGEGRVGLLPYELDAAKRQDTWIAAHTK